MTEEHSENAWTIMQLGEIEMFSDIEELVYEILDSVIVPDFTPENEKEKVKRKRIPESDDQEEFLSEAKIKKKLKVNTKRMQKSEKNKITTPKKEENIQNEKKIPPQPQFLTSLTNLILKKRK